MFFRFLILFLLVVTFLWGGYEWTYSSLLTYRVDEQAGNQGFEIAEGESVESIATRLHEQNIIAYEWVFLRYAGKSGEAQKYQAGYHEVSSKMTIPEISQSLLHAIPQVVTVLVREGLTLAEMDSLFAEKGFFAKGEFLACVQRTCSFSQFSFLPKDPAAREGYFFPATYRIEKSQLSPQNLANEMISTFQEYAQNLKLFSNKRGSLQEILTMASIIEKEWAGTEEGAMISGVLWNRIDKGIPLGADATTRYATQKKSSALTASDLAKDDPFNTRKNKGFPPHAISAPGAKALNAAANPAKTDFLFYLHDQNREIHLAKTNAEHERNKQTYCGGSCL
ncbi:MAG: endolytic transglycosylase MltG [Candidatus Peregrinibacteria bacterium]